MNENTLYVYDESYDELLDELEVEADHLEKCDRIGCNDPFIERIDAISNTSMRYYDDTIWYGYGYPLGEALLNNEVVNRIDLDPFLFLPTDVTSAGRRKVAAPMLRYLRTSTALRCVCLDVDCGADEYEEKYGLMEETLPQLHGRLLQAIARNANITTLICGIELPVSEFTELLTSTKQAIQSMRLEKCAMIGFRSSTSNMLADAFEANQSIQQLYISCTEQSRETVEHIVRRLDARCRTLHTSHITNVTVQVSQPALLDDLLQSKSVLQTLELLKISFDQEDSNHLWGRLALNQSVTKLSLICCLFTEEATTELREFVQTKVNRGSNNVKTLRLDLTGNRAYASGVPTLLMGSALHNLEVIGYVFDGPTFLNEMYLKDSSIRLRCLQISATCLHPSSLLPLTRYLAQTSTLRELQIIRKFPPHDPEQVAHIFRANGSLVRVQVVDCRNEPVELQFESYCARNANLPVLLGGYRDGSSIGTETRNGVSALPLVPSLFTVSKQAPRTAPSTILLGLLALSDSLLTRRSDALRTCD
jgi:hypothetical protein